jgi:hypothetical protein
MQIHASTRCRKNALFIVFEYAHTEAKVLAVRQQRHPNLSHGHLFDHLQKVLWAVRPAALIVAPSRQHVLDTEPIVSLLVLVNNSTAAVGFASSVSWVSFADIVHIVVLVVAIGVHGDGFARGRELLSKGQAKMRHQQHLCQFLFLRGLIDWMMET